MLLFREGGVKFENIESIKQVLNLIYLEDADQIKKLQQILSLQRYKVIKAPRGMQIPWH